MQCEVLSGLWISDCKSLNNKKFIYDKNITFIVNLTNTDVTKYKENKDIDILNISINDSYDIKYNNSYLLDNIHDILSTIQKKLINYNVLISCYSGFHSSVTIAICYLIKYGNVNLEYAYNSIISKNNKLSDIKTRYIYCINNYIVLLKKNNI